MTGELLVLGSAGSAPTATNPGSGYLVRLGGVTIVVDLGPGVFGALAGEVPIHVVDALVVSHGHADHAADLLAWYHAARYGIAPRAAVPAFIPGDALGRVGAFLGKDTGELEMVFDDREPAGAASVLGVGLRFVPARHSVPAVSVRLEGGGRALAYSGDTAPNEELVEVARGADVFLCEATVLEGPVEGHMGADEAGAAAAEAGVGRLVLTHLREDVDPAAAVGVASRAFGGPVAVAEPGLRLSI